MHKRYLQKIVDTTMISIALLASIVILISVDEQVHSEQKSRVLNYEKIIAEIKADNQRIRNERPVF